MCNVVGPNIERHRVYVSKDWSGPAVQHDVGSRNPGKCGHNDFVTRTNSKSRQDQVQTGCTAGSGKSVIGTMHCGKLLFELGDFGALGEPAGLERFTQRFPLLVARTGE
jgi:hypothetical protein